jgi:hypothetical protein
LAGKIFTERFDFENHRWIRYRSVMELLEEYLAQYKDGWGAEPAGQNVAKYREMIPGAPPNSYRASWSQPKADYFRSRSEALVKLAEDWRDPDGTHDFADGAPNPKPTLRVTPDIPSSDES